MRDTRSSVASGPKTLEPPGAWAAYPKRRFMLLLKRFGRTKLMALHLLQSHLPEECEFTLSVIPSRRGGVLWI